MNKREDQWRNPPSTLRETREELLELQRSRFLVKSPASYDLAAFISNNDQRSNREKSYELHT